MEKMRMDKFLSSQLNISRSDAKKLLRSGVVTINGKTESRGDAQLDLSQVTVSVNGNDVCYKKHVYIMLNKPQGVVSASVAPGDITVIDLVPDYLKRAGLFPAGRLDKDTTGFVLITDDGDFAHDILSPSKHVKKTYIVSLERDVLKEEYDVFERGMALGDIILKPAALTRISEKTYEIVISEGRYHQIKRMFAKTGNCVTALKRVKMGELELDTALAPGECRELSSEEIDLIQKR